MLQQICNNHICYFSAGRKLADGKAINGKGRLTNIRIGIFQNIYGHVIRNNKGNSTAMEKCVRASLKHYCSTVEKPQHEDCPEGDTSWCSYQRDKATGKQTHRPVKNPNSGKLTTTEYLCQIIDPKKQQRTAGKKQEQKRINLQMAL